MRVEAVERGVATTLLGPLLTSRLVVASLKARRARGDVVLVPSDATRHPRPRMAAYTAPKAGLEALAHALAMELEGTGPRAPSRRVGQHLTATGLGGPTGA